MYEQMSIFDFLGDEKQPFKIKNKIRLIELFGGIGSQAMALRDLGADFEHYRLVEWDKYPVASYNAIHGTNFKPMDICKTHGDDLGIVDTDKYTYIMTYSFPCALAGTKIKTEYGYKNVEDITLNDKVLTHTNTYQKVMKTMRRKSPSWNRIKILGLPELKLTDEHPMYVLRDNEKQWVKVKDLKLTDMACFNVNTKSVPTRCSNEILWLLGRYVADGHINQYSFNSINFAIGFDKEDSFLQNIKGFSDKFRKFEKRGCMDYRIADKDLQELCQDFGIGSDKKHIPQWVLDLPIEQAKVFLDGYFSGDGHYRVRSGSEQMMFSTVSKELYLGLQDLILKVYGIVCSCYLRIDNRKESFKDTYNCQFSYNGLTHIQKRIGDQVFVPIREINHVEEEVYVFNFEVDKDNSYTCDNVVVHNCQDLSVAGMQKGMSKGSGTRSGLLWEVERILTEIKASYKPLPQVLLMENVPQVHSKKNFADFEQWLKFLEDLGYSNFWQDLNAKDYGIAQNRNRCFCVSILGNYDYKFPEPIELTTVMNDYLEEEVGEEYYVGGERVQKLIDKLIVEGKIPSPQ